MKEDFASVLTLSELSLYIKIPESSIYKLVREGKIPAQKVGKNWRFNKVAIDDWLKGKYQTPNT